MRWQDRRQSTNVEDRRSSTGKMIAFGGGIGGLILTFLLVLLGGNSGENVPDLQSMLQPGGQGETRSLTAEEQKVGQFVSVVLADTEDVWNEIFTARDETYREPKMVLFSNMTNSACGTAQGATGPFFCPEDEAIYVDLDFLSEIQARFNAPGDFAMAYVIAHEVGHSVQKQLGILDQVHSLSGQVSEAEYNQASVRLELQADFLAGVWAYHAQRVKNILEEGDIEEALNAAAAVGDDRIQRQTQGMVVPDSFTHGTSEQRVRWFQKGFRTGDLRQGDTFSSDNL